MTDPITPWVDLKPLSEPVVKLIEAISNAIGTLYEPRQIRQKALAEADAAIILAKNQVDIQDIEFRATKRLLGREVRRQRNIEGITEKAIDALPVAVSEDGVDPDWIFDFFEKAQDVSNKQMQVIWAEILASEFAQPRSFSRRTLEILRNLSADEAKLFENLCSFVWVCGDTTAPVIFDEQAEIYSRIGLDFDGLRHLESTGLINYESLTGFATTTEIDRVDIMYFGSGYKLTLPSSELQILLGNVLFTKAGAELLSVTNAESYYEFEQYAIEYWLSKGFEIEQIQSPA